MSPNTWLLVLQRVQVKRGDPAGEDLCLRHKSSPAGSSRLHLIENVKAVIHKKVLTSLCLQEPLMYTILFFKELNNNFSHFRSLVFVGHVSAAFNFVIGKFSGFLKRIINVTCVRYHIVVFCCEKKCWNF